MTRRTALALAASIGLASMAFSPERDPHLKQLDATALFSANTSRVAVRRGSYLGNYAYRLIELCSGGLSEKAIREEISSTKNLLSA
jgi:LysR family cys regulon transcriptional activator